MIKTSKPDVAGIPLRILIADGSTVISEGLSATLSEQAGILVAGCANNAIQALVLIETAKPDVVLLDLQMPGDRLVSMLQLIKRTHSTPVAIVLTPYPSGALRERCLSAGADYVFAKSAELGSMIEVLEKLVAAKTAGTKK